MVDNLTKAQRSYCMSRIKRKNTCPELKYKKVKKKLIYQPNEFGNPDFIDYKARKVIFIDGCFWHKCPKHYIEPKSNRKYWLPKLERNISRSKEVDKAYQFAGWEVVRIWEHDLF